MIERNVKVSVPVEKVAKELGWEVEFDFDDFWHNGYSAKDVQKGLFNIPSKYDGAELVFPSAVAMAMEDADRSQMEADARKAALSAIEEAAQKLSVPGEYQDQDGNMISKHAEVKSAEVIGDDLVLEIENPEHLINDISNGVDGSIPLSSEEAASDQEIKNLLPYIIGQYFEVYGERKPDPNLDSRYQAAPSEETLIDHLDFRVKGEATADDAAQAISDLMDRDDDTDPKELSKLAEKVSGGNVKAKDVLTKVREIQGQVAAKAQARAKKAED